MFVVCNEMIWCHSFRLLNIGCSSLLYCCTPILMLVIFASLVYWLMLVVEYTLTQIIITWFDYTPFTLVWEGCVACYHIIWKLVFDNLSLISYTLKPLSTLVVCVVFPHVSFITSGPERWPTWAMHPYIRCIVSWSVFFSFHLFIQDSWPWLVIFLENIISKKNVA